MAELKELIKAYDLREKNNDAAYLVALIGILTVINCLFLIFRIKFTFTGGLGILTVFQVVLFDMVPEKNIAMASAIVVLVSLAFSVGMFFLCWKIMQAKKWAYLTAIIIYTVDSLLLFYCSDFVGFAIHGLLLWCLYSGYKVIKELANMDETLEKLDELLDGENRKEKD